MNNHALQDRPTNESWRRNTHYEADETKTSRTTLKGFRQPFLNETHSKDLPSSGRGHGMIPQADPWRSKRVLQKRSQQEAHAPSNVYYSTQHTNGTTYYYSSQQVIQMQQQQYINHEDSNGYSNADSTNTNGANAQWRSHQPQQTKQPEKVHSSDTKPKKQVESKKGYYHPDDRPNKNKESLYSPFLNPRDMDAGLQDGTLYEGVLKVGRSRLDCYVVTDELEHDIYIGGNRDRNRAFHGDRVVVRLKDVEESWKLKKERTERWKQKRKVQIKEEMKKYREESESDEDESDDSSYNEEDNKPKYCGEVVGIKYRAPGLAFSGTISVFRDGNTDIDPNNTKMTIAWFRPTDKKVPLLVIPPRLVPMDLLKNQEYYSLHNFVATFKDWRIFEQSPNVASFELVGPKGAFETEKQCILQDNDIVTTEFSKMALAGLPRTPWVIPLQEYVKRLDLRTKRVFTIDPRTAKDLDDAMHIDVIGEDLYQVGVHIADVSHFLKRNTPLDTEARERGTSTYFVDGVIPMLPALLSEELCSLNPGVDRLAFSVIWKMNKKGDILETWFGKTVIRSCAKLAYEDAQGVIEGGHLSDTISTFHNQPRHAIESDILLLLDISKSLREKRYQDGALSLNSVKLSFELDASGIPIAVSPYEIKEANRLIEEFMLRANISVAHRVLQNYPGEALLRRHEEPNEKRLEDFRLLTEKLGLDFDISSAGALQKSFESIANDDLKSVLQMIATRPMKRAKYFCTGSMEVSKYEHYALNEPLYTHFTSPIRRYADVIIHRELFAAIEGKKLSPYSKQRIKEIASDCNRKRDGAQNAQDLNSLLYLGVYLNNLEVKHGPVHSRAIIVSIRKKGFDLYLPEYGLEKSIGLNRLPIENSIFDKHRYILSLFWKRGVPVTMHNEEKIYAQNKRPNFEEEEDMDEEDELDLSGLALDGDIQFPVKPFFNNQTCMQELRMFSPMDVRIQVNMSVSPPYINVYPINHFADLNDAELRQEE